ncbi:GntR family transcriptional regulator [Sphingosinicella rhizophila]|uniref:GntR family transcriptional regulator n=1 Tax=Sphingosinicella rhizophila TaxID=3050082 RepID=A0ABU3Q695_9SPHN|nr:GntR family transcriptional regulator [Sphingosinicella sp. GR2756]MDT9598842.1 GntR family transcriptional regulator [Sphingosinicella sp. GR2756]
MNNLVIRNLSDQLVDLVRDRILNGTVAADQAIRQDALAAELGVSKIPLREALTRLEQEGLVRNHVNRGYFVRSLGAAEAEEVFALRLKLEPEVVALAARRATDAERQHATMAHDALDEETEAHGDGVGALNRAFHLALIRPSGQAITTMLLERLHVLSQRYVRKHLEPFGRDQRANDEHRTILQLWLDRDAKAVAKATHAHIRSTIVDLRRQFTAQGD